MLSEKSIFTTRSDDDSIGLAISAQFLTLLKIKHVNDQYEVEYFEVIDMPQGLIVDNEIKNPVAVANILKNIFNDIPTKNVVICVPHSSAIVKTMNVDRGLQAGKIEARVWAEAKRLFPNLINDIYLDFTTNDQEVLIVACRKDQINPYLDVMKSAGLNAKIVDINYHAYQRALALITKQSPETTVLLNINFKLIELLVVNEGKLIYSHESSFDGADLLKLAKQSGMSIPDAQLLTSDTQVNEILKNTIGPHLKHAMQFFHSNNPDIHVNKIVLSGDAAALIPGFQDFVQQELEKEVVMANPFREMKLASGVDEARLMTYAPGMMLCCGLALGSDFNLLPWRKQLYQDRKKRVLILSGLGVAAALLMLTPFYIYYNHAVQQQQKTLAQEELPNVLDRVLKLAHDNDLNIVAFNPNKEIKDGSYYKTPVNIDLNGNYTQIANFVSELVNMPEKVNVKNFVLNNSDETSVDAVLTAQMDIEIYKK